MTNFFKNKKILITGHTGFKGSWLSCVLNYFGAKVYGISHKKNVSLIYKKKISKYKKEFFFNLNNLQKTKKIISKVNPDIIFHLAAQSLVYKSFEKPLITWQSNLIGSLNIMLSLSELKRKVTLIMITSDKCYKNKETNKGYTEVDELGGEDPYSASKAATEIMINSHFASFLKKNKKIKIASVRAGNVIGGGDWSNHRLVPDIIKSWIKNKKVKISNPKSTRPWQHVLEPLNGYLRLAYMLNKNNNLNGQSFNFGPNKKNNFTVLDLTKELSKPFKKKNQWITKNFKKFHETKLLRLNSSKSEKLLKWKPILNFKDTAEYTAQWYINYFYKKKNLQTFTMSQIIKFFEKNAHKFE